jgi:8-oxo-dGTP pyrophosphatase MutT (NUDIX family)
MSDSVGDAIRRVLSRNPKRSLDDPSLVPAGVMLLVYPKDGEYCILLNKRTDTVEHHKGEISFPGGSQDEEDRTLLETALRETEEEMGIRSQDIEVLGELDDVTTNSRFCMSPYVGTIPASYDFRPSAIEVAEVLEVPISSLVDLKNVRDEARIVDGRLEHSPTYAHRDHLVYGATARVIARFVELLDSAPDKEAPWKTKPPQ